MVACQIPDLKVVCSSQADLNFWPFEKNDFEVYESYGGRSSRWYGMTHC